MDGTRLGTSREPAFQVDRPTELVPQPLDNQPGRHFPAPTAFGLVAHTAHSANDDETQVRFTPRVASTSTTRSGEV